MHFGMSEEQAMIVETTRAFVEKEIYPHELEVERTGHLPMEIVREVQAKAIEAGLYAANMPEEVGGAGLDTLSWLMYDKELGRANYALHWTCVARPSNILLAGTDEQKEKYLFPCIKGEKWDCLAMTEPGAGSDLRGMKASARRDGDDWILNGTKHFISHADIADFSIVFMATGEEDTPRGKKKLITAFFVDKGTPGLTIRDGYRNVSHRGYTNAVLEFDDCRLPQSAVLGEVHKGFEVANTWLGATRLQVAATWKFDQGTVTESDMSMAKLKATEMLAMVADEAIQIHGGMGLMDELPLERIWRDARVERIWEGTSEIQRHIISREMLRPLGG